MIETTKYDKDIQVFALVDLDLVKLGTICRNNGGFVPSFKQIMTKSNIKFVRLSLNLLNDKKFCGIWEIYVESCDNKGKNNSYSTYYYNVFDFHGNNMSKETENCCICEEDCRIVIFPCKENVELSEILEKLSFNVELERLNMFM